MGNPSLRRARQDGITDRLPADLARPYGYHRLGTITGVVVGAGLLGLCLLGLGYAITVL
jgi:hypothetical protein